MRVGYGVSGRDQGGRVSGRGMRQECGAVVV